MEDKANPQHELKRSAPTKDPMGMKIELIPVPVTDDDRAVDFYVKKVGFLYDHDFTVHEGLRFIQLTPVESACSIVIGKGTTTMTPGTQSIQVVVNDVRDLRQRLIDRGVEVSDIDEQAWGIFAEFKDPDGNTWSLQQVLLPSATEPHHEQ